MTTATPLRNPDASSPHLMTKRGWWLVGMNILLPGSAQLVAGDLRLGRVGIVATLLLWLLVLCLFRSARQWWARHRAVSWSLLVVLLVLCLPQAYMAYVGQVVGRESRQEQAARHPTLSEPARIRGAIDGVMAAPDAVLGREVALFPPVTGG